MTESELWQTVLEISLLDAAYQRTTASATTFHGRRQNAIAFDAEKIQNRG